MKGGDLMRMSRILGMMALAVMMCLPTFAISSSDRTVYEQPTVQPGKIIIPKRAGEAHHLRSAGKFGKREWEPLFRNAGVGVGVRDKLPARFEKPALPRFCKPLVRLIDHAHARIFFRNFFRLVCARIIDNDYFGLVLIVFPRLDNRLDALADIFFFVVCRYDKADFHPVRKLKSTLCDHKDG